jgi:hypothetical protein
MSDWLHLKPYGYAPGNYMGTCRSCKQGVIGIDKRAPHCRPCAQQLHDAAHPFTERREIHQPEATNWAWVWRRLHTLGNLPWRSSGWRSPQDYVDVGYCLDRYSIEGADGNVTRSEP